MSKFTLVDGLFLYPTPVGAYYAVSSTEGNKPRKFLKRLLQQSETPVLNHQTLTGLMDESNEEKALELLHHCQKLGWVQGVDSKIQSPQGRLEDTLPELLINITESKKVLLADNQGFYLACSGFPHEVAEELSALSAEIATVHERRSGLLMNNLGLGSHAWAVVDPFGSSQTGFWPIFIGKTRFVITISGVPHFNQADFVTLIWALSIRYAN
jgi:hypothetical protein